VTFSGSPNTPVMTNFGVDLICIPHVGIEPTSLPSGVVVAKDRTPGAAVNLEPAIFGSELRRLIH